jgi:cytidine deaminase
VETPSIINVRGKMDKQTLWNKACSARLNAHAPYSNFRVGAALLADDGQIYSGCNVENAAYPQGTCAEAGAISAMIAAGAKRIQSVVVVADGDFLVSPCGGCRQKLREFCADEVPIFLSNLNGIQQETTMAELMPSSFGAAHLESSQND